MIEIKARILRRSVFITGECVECELIITNHGRIKTNLHYADEKKYKNSRHNLDTHLYGTETNSKTMGIECDKNVRKDESVTLAWASAQVYCHCNINERQMKPPVNLRNQIGQSHTNFTNFTSFSPVMGKKGHCLCSTSASVLFCDLRLTKGESKRFLYSQSLPMDLPPSYKGQNIKFSYKVCIGIGRIRRPLSMIRLPFRLFEMKGVFKSLKDKASDAHSSEGDAPVAMSEEGEGVNNPFLPEDFQEKCSMLDAAVQALTTYTLRRNMNTYNIQSAKGAVGKFCLSKYYYRLGEDVLGTFDFSEGPISCIKYTVSLQVEETISKNCLLHPSSSNFIQHITISSHEECCCLATKTHFLLPIPVTATSEFTHKIVSIRWRLHFEFIIDSTEHVDGNNGILKDSSSRIPRKIKTEPMIWDLPLHVLSTNPIQASLMMQAESTETIYLSNS